jgi:hypothetical protein
MFIATPPEEVWKCLTDPEYLPLWNKEVQEVTLIQSYSEGEVEVLGTFRHLYEADGRMQRQVITYWQPCRMLEYSVIEGPEFEDFHVCHHVGQFKLNPCLDGTELHWLNYIEYRETLNSPFWMSLLVRRFRRNLIFLKWCLENARAKSLCFA